MSTIEAFEKVVKGHRVAFSPKAATFRATGQRKRVKGSVYAIDGDRATVIDGGGNQWIVPYNKLRRSSNDVHKEFSSAKRKALEAEVYGGLDRASKKALRECSKDARQASLGSCLGDYSGPLSKEVLTEMKRCREASMREAGIEDTTDRGQCQALPHLVLKSLARGKVPSLKSIKFVSAENGTVGIGDIIPFAGHKYKLTGFTRNDEAILKNGREILVPMGMIPMDNNNTKPTSLVKQHRRKPKPARRFKGARQKKYCYCLLRDKRGRFLGMARRRRMAKNPELLTVCALPGCIQSLGIGSSGPGILSLANPGGHILVDADLFGHETARLSGTSERGSQAALFKTQHELTQTEKAEQKELAAWRKKRAEEKELGQADLLENPQNNGTSEYEFRRGSDRVLVSERSGRYSARLYREKGKRKTPWTWHGKSLTDAEKWANGMFDGGKKKTQEPKKSQTKPASGPDEFPDCLTEITPLTFKQLAVVGVVGLGAIVLLKWVKGTPPEPIPMTATIIPPAALPLPMAAVAQGVPRNEQAPGV